MSRCTARFAVIVRMEVWSKKTGKSLSARCLLPGEFQSSWRRLRCSFDLPHGEVGPLAGRPGQMGSLTQTGPVGPLARSSAVVNNLLTTTAGGLFQVSMTGGSSSHAKEIYNLSFSGQ